MMRPVEVASGTGDVQAVAAGDHQQLVGFSFTEDAGTPAAAQLRLHNGTDATGTELFDLKLAASETVIVFFSAVSITGGLFVDRVSGTTTGTVYIG